MELTRLYGRLQRRTRTRRYQKRDHYDHEKQKQNGEIGIGHAVNTSVAEVYPRARQREQNELDWIRLRAVPLLRNIPV